jgi:hypothetical protein
MRGSSAEAMQVHDRTADTLSVPLRLSPIRARILRQARLANMGGECCNRTVPTMRPSGEYPQLAVGPVGKQIHSIYQSRLRQFTDNGQYREQGLMGYVHNHKPL